MDFRDTPEEAAFRTELRAWFEANVPDGEGTGPSSPLERRRLQGVEQEALRRRLRRPDLAEGVRGQRGSLHAPGDLPRGDRPGRGARAHRRHRARDGGADDHRPRNRRTEGALPQQDPVRRGGLVPGLLGAGLGFRPRVAEDAGRARRRRVRRQRAEGVVVVRSHRRLLHPRGHAPIPRPPSTRGSRICSSTCIRRASRFGRSTDHRRPRVQRDLLHRRARSASEHRRTR